VGTAGVRPRRRTGHLTHVGTRHRRDDRAAGAAVLERLAAEEAKRIRPYLVDADVKIRRVRSTCSVDAPAPAPRGSAAWRANLSAAMRAAWQKRKTRRAQTSAPHATVAPAELAPRASASPASSAPAAPIPPPAVFPREAARTRMDQVAPVRRGARRGR